MNHSILTHVKSALAATLKISAESISDQARLREDLALDSMLSLTFLMTLEDRIDGFIVDGETLTIEDLIDVSSISHYVARQLGEVRSE